MSYALRSKEAAEQEAARLNKAANGREYEAAPYEWTPDNRPLRWGVLAYELGYVRGLRRCMGFVWQGHRS